MNDVLTNVRELLTGRFGVAADEFSADATLSDLDMDSLALVEFGLVAEKEFGVKVTEDEVSPYDTVADLVRLIEAKRA